MAGSALFLTIPEMRGLSPASLPSPRSIVCVGKKLESGRSQARVQAGWPLLKAHLRRITSNLGRM